MQGIVVRILIIVLGLVVAAALVPGVRIEGAGNFLLAGIVLGLVNAFIRPIAFILTLPFTVITLGLFLLVLNSAMFGLAAAMLDGFAVDGFGSAFFGALIVSLTGVVASWYVGPNGRVEILVIRR